MLETTNVQNDVGATSGKFVLRFDTVNHRHGRTDSKFSFGCGALEPRSHIARTRALSLRWVSGRIGLIVLTLWFAASLFSSGSAQTTKRERLDQIIMNLRTCVKANAPAANASGIQANEDAVDYFMRACSLPPDALNPVDVGVLPPGILRNAINSEWETFIRERQAR